MRPEDNGDDVNGPPSKSIDEVLHSKWDEPETSGQTGNRVPAQPGTDEQACECDDAGGTAHAEDNSVQAEMEVQGEAAGAKQSAPEGPRKKGRPRATRERDRDRVTAKAKEDDSRREFREMVRQHNAEFYARSRSVPQLRDWGIDPEGGPFVAIPEDMRAKYGVPFEALVSYEITRDNMSPTLMPGDHLLLDQSARHITQDGIYLLRFPDGHMGVRRVQMQVDGTLILGNDNSFYPPYKIKAKKAAQLQIAGRVVGHLKVLGEALRRQASSG